MNIEENKNQAPQALIYAPKGSSVLGNLSLFLSFIPVFLYIAQLFWALSFKQTTGVNFWDLPNLFSQIMFFFGVVLVSIWVDFGIRIMGIALAIGSFFQPRRKRTTAILGLMFNFIGFLVVGTFLFLKYVPDYDIQSHFQIFQNK